MKAKIIQKCWYAILASYIFSLYPKYSYTLVDQGIHFPVLIYVFEDICSQSIFLRCVSF